MITIVKRISILTSINGRTSHVLGVSSQKSSIFKSPKSLCKVTAYRKKFVSDEKRHLTFDSSFNIYHIVHLNFKKCYFYSRLLIYTFFDSAAILLPRLHVSYQSVFI